MKIIQTMADIEEGVAALRLLDPRLERVIDKAGAIPLRLREPGFEGLAHIIVSQMVSRASADAIWSRMVAGTGTMTAESFLSVDETKMATLGLSRAKMKTLIGLATSIANGDLDLFALSRLDGEQALAPLTALSGIGPWTAEVYLMFCEGHVDLFPAGDVALQAAVMHALGLEARPGSKALSTIALFWSPWRSVAARIFWAYYAVITRREAVPIA